MVCKRCNLDLSQKPLEVNISFEGFFSFEIRISVMSHLMAFGIEEEELSILVPLLLKSLGVRWVNPNRTVGESFVIEVDSSETLDSFTARMARCVHGHQDKYIEMHRCYQTLALGRAHNDNWRKRNIKNVRESHGVFLDDYGYLIK